MLDEAIAELAPLDQSAHKNHSVLIVDDDTDQAAVLCHRLEKLGYRTLCASHGREGILAARKHLPSLVLLDLRMPEIDGFEVCQKLADDPATCGIPVIVLSGMERPDIIRRTRWAGSQYYVRKPYDPNVLLVLIENAIGQADF